MIVAFITLIFHAAKMHIYCQKGHFLAVAHSHRFSSFTVMLRSRKPTFVSLPLALIGGVLAVRLTSALALIPLVFNGDKPGNEIQSPMTIVVLGGLITSTLLNIFVMPIVYGWYAKRKSSKTEQQ